MTNDEDIKQEVEETESLDFNNPAFTFTPSGRHTYRQEGFYLVCKSCELHHAVFIGSNMVMVGETEEGQPILKNKKEVGL